MLLILWIWNSGEIAYLFHEAWVTGAAQMAIDGLTGAIDLRPEFWLQFVSSIFLHTVSAGAEMSKVAPSFPRLAPRLEWLEQLGLAGYHHSLSAGSLCWASLGCLTT